MKIPVMCSGQVINNCFVFFKQNTWIKLKRDSARDQGTKEKLSSRQQERERDQSRKINSVMEEMRD